MTRLSIIDLACGNQPFTGCRMPVTCMVNGEIYKLGEAAPARAALARRWLGLALPGVSGWGVAPAA